MRYKVDNAIIMAAGTSSRFAPLSYERPKALIEVRGEILIERQIRQLKEAGIKEIILVVGYKKEQFEYLEEKYGVILVENKEYLVRNNNSSIYAVKEYLKNSYVCSSDNYFMENPFETSVDDAYYAAVFSQGQTKEWCMEEDKDGYISNVTIGGENAWYMLGHTFWSEEFSRKFIEILENIYDLPGTRELLWESIFMEHLDKLKMKIRKYTENYIFEFDTLDELREFDTSYVENTRSHILKSISKELECKEKDIREVQAVKDDSNEAVGCRFQVLEQHFEYNYETQKIRRV
ncbi:NTP transferase domain-containing protein [Candidatus Merdisoma sp. HCP28S3_D10]|uniref:NTP transferase domain-containing protein n=1 Tax=unclassified Candidatus Merdisoma TaxID=3099611 RepID=UPI003F88D35C